MIFVGIDWAEAHHDVCLLDDGGQVLAKRRVASTPKSQLRLWSASRLTAACWSAPCWPPATRCLRSIRLPRVDIETGTRPQVRSQIPAMLECWPTWFGLTVTNIGRSRATLSLPRR